MEKLPASVAPPAAGERGGLGKVGAQREQGKVNPRSPADSAGQQKPSGDKEGDVGATNGAQRGAVGLGAAEGEVGARAFRGLDKLGKDAAASFKFNNVLDELKDRQLSGNVRLKSVTPEVSRCGDRLSLLEGAVGELCEEIKGMRMSPSVLERTLTALSAPGHRYASTPNSLETRGYGTPAGQEVTRCFSFDNTGGGGSDLRRRPCHRWFSWAL